MPAAQHAGDPDCSESFPRLRGWPIGNTDRHHGNISLVLVHCDGHLSPSCDMLPMLCMPIAAEVVVQELGGGKEGADGPDAGCVDEAQTLALASWEAVVQKERISGGFRELARGNLLALAAVSRTSEN